MNRDNHQPGGIRARRIQADNVVSGAQIQGGDPLNATELIQAAEALRRGEIVADEIFARSVISGLQYISDPAQATTEDLRNELKTLSIKVEQAIATQEIADAADAEDVTESLGSAERELAKAQPSGNRVLRKLDDASAIITKSAEAAEAAGKLSAQVIKLAPIAAMLWQIAQRLFGV